MLLSINCLVNAVNACHRNGVDKGERLCHNIPSKIKRKVNLLQKIIFHLAMDEKFKNSVVTALSTPKTNKYRSYYQNIERCDDNNTYKDSQYVIHWRSRLEFVLFTLYKYWIIVQFSFISHRLFFLLMYRNIPICRPIGSSVCSI